MPNLVSKHTVVTFYYEAFDCNYKRNIINSTKITFNGCGTLDDFIKNAIDSLKLIKKDVFQYSISEVTEKHIKSVSIDKGVECIEIL